MKRKTLRERQWQQQQKKKKKRDDDDEKIDAKWIKQTANL